jgi:ribonuclease P protein component
LLRLKTRAQFQAVLADATVARSPHFALHRAALDVLAFTQQASVFSFVRAPVPLAQRDVWMGAMVPKRWAKRAVTRNLIKRQIDAVSKDFEAMLLAAAYVVRLRADFDRTQFTSSASDVLKVAVRQELQQLLARSTGSRFVPIPTEGAS